MDRGDSLRGRIEDFRRTLSDGQLAVSGGFLNGPNYGDT